ncbi:MAG: TIR domain-containing protein [Sphingomonas sp.]
MAKLARLSTVDRSSDAEGRAQHVPRLRTRYYAFLSYSHRDKELADWLHRELERFRVPHSLAGKLTANGVVPRRLTPIFRDQHDLSAGADLAEEIKAALAASQFLVVLCSPTAAASRWTNAEIESFKRTRPEGCVLAAVAAGEPFASDIPGREDEECFPPALRYKYDRRGHQTTKRAEPLAADFRDDGDGKRLALLKLVAGMLGVGLDELVQREQTRRHRRMAWLAAASLGGMAVTSTLAVAAFQSRNEAREQRREAEGLIGFMLGDLKGKLEPIGRLDALDGVGSRVLAYYQKMGTADLSDAALSQRSKALTLMAQVADARGDVDGSLRLYRAALAGTAEAVRRNPADSQAIFDHAQNVFYLGEIAQNRGDLRGAEASMREYKRLALRMVALQPDNMKYRMEEQYADTDVGVLLFDQRRFDEAVTQFEEALGTMGAIATADPTNPDYRMSVAESLAWLADAQRATGRYSDAIATRQRGIALLQDLLSRTRDVEYRKRLVPARLALGALYSDTGQSDLAVQQFRSAIDESTTLGAVEPSNTQWVHYGFNARVGLVGHLLSRGKAQQATVPSDEACAAVQGLVARKVPASWSPVGLRECWTMRAGIALATGQNEAALDNSRRAVSGALTVHSSDPAADRFALAKAYRLVGDSQRALGDSAAAATAWRSALAALPRGATEKPTEMDEHATILQRVGRSGEARSLTAKLSSIGYRLPT